MYFSFRNKNEIIYLEKKGAVKIPDQLANTLPLGDKSIVNCSWNIIIQRNLEF